MSFCTSYLTRETFESIGQVITNSSTFLANNMPTITSFSVPVILSATAGMLSPWVGQRVFSSINPCSTDGKKAPEQYRNFKIITTITAALSGLCGTLAYYVRVDAPVNQWTVGKIAVATLASGAIAYLQTNQTQLKHIQEAELQKALEDNLKQLVEFETNIIKFQVLFESMQKELENPVDQKNVLQPILDLIALLLQITHSYQKLDFDTFVIGASNIKAIEENRGLEQLFMKIKEHKNLSPEKANQCEAQAMKSTLDQLQKAIQTLKTDKDLQNIQNFLLLHGTEMTRFQEVSPVSVKYLNFLRNEKKVEWLNKNFWWIGSLLVPIEDDIKKLLTGK